MEEPVTNRPEYAPMYNRAERWRILGKVLSVVMILGAVVYFFIAPWFRNYLPTAHCQSYGSWNGLELVLTVMLVAAPLILALILAVIEGKKCLWIIRHRQTPIAGEKVMKPTRYRYGKAALIRPLALLMALLVLIMMALWSAYWIQHMMSSVKISAADCEQIQQTSQRFSSTFDTGDMRRISLQ